jgi:hypothetical protein
VVIPEGVTRIGGEAFLGCTSLPSVVIPESVTEIGYMAFLGSNNKLVIHAPKGSYAIEYSRKYQIKYVEV